MKAKEKIKEKNKQIDWESLELLDLKDEPAISWNLTTKAGMATQQVLELAPQSRRRQKVLRVLSQEFEKAYVSYRKMRQRRDGLFGTFEISREYSKKYCCKAAVNCLRNGITPRQLLEYWDENIENFADSGMRFPPLSFVSSEYAAEQVAACLIGNGQWAPGAFKKNKNRKFGHSFSSTEGLSVKLRRGLINAGFDNVKTYSDRHLMSIQNTAKAIANGRKIFVGSSMYEMVMWAVNNIFCKCNDKDRKM